MSRNGLQRAGVFAAALVLVGACGTKDETSSSGEVGATARAGNTASAMSAPTMTSDTTRRDSTGLPVDSTHRDTTRKP